MKIANKLNLRKKLIFYCYATIAPVLLFISTILTIKNYEDNQEKRILTQTQSVQTLEDSIDVLRSDIQNICTYLCVNEDILKILRSSQADQLNQNFQLWLDDAPMNIVLDILAVKGNINTIAIYPENGVNPYLRCLDSASYINDIGQVRSGSFYDKAVQANGTVCWSYVGKGANGIYQTNRADKIVLYREMFDLSKKHRLGFLVLGTNADRFVELCKNAVIQKDECILVLTPQGEKLFSYGSSAEEAETRLLSDFSWKTKKSFGMFGEDGYDVFWSQNTKSSFVICKIVPQTGVGMLIKEAVGTPIILLAVLLIGLCPIFLFISKVITDPLHRLTIAMEKFQQGDFTQKISIESQDELGMVAGCFNKMVENIKELIDTNYVMALQEKESELNALQAQINPHFLYNTLDALYWKAVESENKEMEEDILALSNLFRLLLGQGKAMLTLCEEKSLIEAYLHVQKMRFSKRLEYEIRISDDIDEVVIPKLILQPFVENAVVHGFENVETKCLLTVEGHELKDKPGYIEFRVKDTGNGMTQEQLADIWKTAETKQYASQRIGHYAIRNVKERLELKYHGDYILEIASEIGKGTCVRIVIPKEERSRV